MAAELVIHPEEIRTAAGSLSEAIESLEGAVRNIEGLVNGSSRFWEGIAAGIHQLAWETMQENLLTVLGKLKEHPAELLETAGETIGVMERSHALVSALPTDIIN